MSLPQTNAVPEMRCLIVVPTYNEIENLREIVANILEHAPAANIVIVDDESEDGTGALADELCAEHPDKVFVIHRPRKDGLGRAYVAGFKFALARDYEYILQMDADFSHDPSYLPRFFEKIIDHDLVIGSRYLTGISVVNWDLKRLMLSRAATGYVRFVTRLPLTDATSGFKCWRREVLEAIDLDKIFSSGYLFQVEMSYRTHQKDFRMAEIPIIFVERRLGRSKMDWGIITEAILGVIRMRLRG